MAKFLEQGSSALSSSSAYSSVPTAFGAAASRPGSKCARVISGPTRSSSSSSWSRTPDLSWGGGARQNKRGKKAAILVPASMVVEERGSGKAEMTVFRENLISSFQQNGNGLYREEVEQERQARAESESDASTSSTSEDDQEEDVVWLQMRDEAREDSDAEPVLASYMYSTILAHKSLERALAFHLGNKLSSATFLSTQLVTVFIDTIMESEAIREGIRLDIIAVRERDPACVSYAHCLLNFKGFLALQAHRVANRLWTQGRKSLALAMQSRVSEVFHVDIHPGAQVGSGILFDHATGVVVGETAVIGNNVSILHHVTLGGTGAVVGDRHPKIGNGVLIGAGATILGNITVGDGAKIGAGSVVLTDIPALTTAVGNPARLVGGKKSPKENKDIPGETMDHTSFMAHWSDYVI